MTTKTQLTIVTGASRGLGLAVAQLSLSRGHQVLGLSRRPPAGPALAAPGQWQHWAMDLADAVAASERLAGWLGGLDPAAIGSVTLINNAAALSSPTPLDGSDPLELSMALRVGLEAPMLLSAAFLRATRDWTAPRRLLLVSSGLGRRAMAGAACYCAAKAGLDHLARALALEQADTPNGAKVVSLAPGVIDTDMQVALRSADPECFPERQRFADLATRGLLDSPEQAAAKLMAFLERADFGSNPVADVRDP